MDRITSKQIKEDRELNGLSYRKLALKYKVDHVKLYRMLMKKPIKQRDQASKKVSALPVPDDINALKEELRKARLKIELQDLMIDISSEELGVDIRKKHGTRQSE